MTAACALLSVPLLTGGCAANGYAGIPFATGAADSELQALARRAQAGDKRAQLELGIRYEEGRGVAADLGRAERLYRLAASDSGGTVHIYSPPVGRHGSGRVVPVNTGVPQAGLPEARARLAALNHRSAVSKRPASRREPGSGRPVRQRGPVGAKDPLERLQ